MSSNREMYGRAVAGFLIAAAAPAVFLVLFIVGMCQPQNDLGWNGWLIASGIAIPMGGFGLSLLSERNDKR